MVINIMTRDVWHAEPPKLETPTNWKATRVFWMNVKKTICFTKIHCIELLKRAQLYNMTVQNQRDIRYNFMIGADGNVYEGRGWGHTPLLPKEYSRVNPESVVIGFMGYFNTAKDLPEDMFRLGQDLVAYGVANDFITKDFQFFDLLSQEHKWSPDQQFRPATNAPRRRVYGEEGGDFQPSNTYGEGYGSKWYQSLHS